MKHDLVDVLHNPLRFMAETGRRMIREPRSIPIKALDYAKYDLVRVVNEVMDALGLSESLFERVVDKFLAVPAARFLWMKRSLSMLISDRDEDGRGRVVRGEYQTPIMVQWRQPTRTQSRLLRVRLVRFT